MQRRKLKSKAIANLFLISKKIEYNTSRGELRSPPLTKNYLLPTLTELGPIRLTTAHRRHLFYLAIAGSLTSGRSIIGVC